MSRARTLSLVGVLLAGAWASSPASLQAEEKPSRAAAMAGAAETWLAGLTPAQRKQAALPFGHRARMRWQATPGQRVGLAWGDMTKSQRAAAETLLGTGLSEGGIGKFRGVVILEGVLRTQAAARRRISPSWRDPGLYWIAVFGAPSAKGTWSWRLEGHHYSRHFTCVAGRVATAPAFHGANPARVAEGPRKGTRVLAREEDVARALLTSLDGKRRAQAVVRAGPRDFLPGSPRDLSRLPRRGLRAADMTESQRKALWQLIEVYTSTLHADLAAQVLARAKGAEPGEIRFAWMGAPEPGRSHGYHVQGSTFYVEYWQGGNHIHTVWRDPSNEYGTADLVRENR